MVGLVALVSRPLWYVGLGTGGSVRFIEGLQRAQGVLPVDGNRNYAEDSVTWVSWYTGWPTLVLAGAALALLTRYAVLGRRDPVSGTTAARWVLGLGLPVVSALSVLWSPGITPDHPWADRRLVPTVLPVVALLAVWAVAAATRRWGRPALALGLVLVLVPAAYGSRHLALSRTEAGEPQAVDTACAAFAPGEVALLVDARSRQEWTAVLREVCDVPAFGVPGDGSDDVATRAQVAEVVARVRAAGGTPVLVAAVRRAAAEADRQPQRQIVDLRHRRSSGASSGTRRPGWPTCRCSSGGPTPTDRAGPAASDRLAGHVLAYPVDDLGGRRARGEDLRHAQLGQRAEVVGRDDAAAEDHHVVRAALAQQLEHPGEQRHVRAGEHRQADRVGVLLDRRLDDLLGVWCRPV